MLKYLVALHAMFAARIRNDERGATMVEYGLMVALIAVVSILAVTAIGLSLNEQFEWVEANIPAVP